MKKRRKTKLIATLTAMLFFSVTAIAPISASANSITRTINGNYLCASSNIFSSGGSGSTVSTGNVYVTVSSTYNYINYLTLVSGSKSDYKSGNGSVAVSFSVSGNNKSVSISSSHTASSGSEYWSGSTSAVY